MIQVFYDKLSYSAVCDKQLISDIQSVANAQFSASSTVDGTYPSDARLDNPSGWQARAGDSLPWLQVDLGEPVTVSGIITQGVKVCLLSVSTLPAGL